MTPVTVIIRDWNGNETQRKHVDHDDREDRQWMGKAAFWAMRNEHSMETVPGHVGERHSSAYADTALSNQPA